MLRAFGGTVYQKREYPDIRYRNTRVYEGATRISDIPSGYLGNRYAGVNPTGYTLAADTYDARYCCTSYYEVRSTRFLVRVRVLLWQYLHILPNSIQDRMTNRANGDYSGYGCKKTRHAGSIARATSSSIRNKGCSRGLLLYRSSRRIT